MAFSFGLYLESRGQRGEVAWELSSKGDCSGLISWGVNV